MPQVTMKIIKQKYRQYSLMRPYVIGGAAYVLENVKKKLHD